MLPPGGCLGWSLLGGRKILRLPQLRVKMPTFSSGSQSSQEWAYRPEDQVRTRQWNRVIHETCGYQQDFGEQAFPIGNKSQR